MLDNQILNDRSTTNSASQINESILLFFEFTQFDYYIKNAQQKENRMNE